MRLPSAAGISLTVAKITPLLRGHTIAIWCLSSRGLGFSGLTPALGKVPVRLPVILPVTGRHVVLLSRQPAASRGSRKEGLMLRRTKYAAIVLAIAMPAVLGGAQAAQATPLVQTCTTQSGHQLCFNQKGGLNNYNQPVIGYPPGDDNNAFGFKYMSLMCG